MQHVLINTDHSHSPLNYLQLKLHVNSINELSTSYTSQPYTELYSEKEPKTTQKDKIPFPLLYTYYSMIF